MFFFIVRQGLSSKSLIKLNKSWSFAGVKLPNRRSWDLVGADKNCFIVIQQFILPVSGSFRAK